MKLENVQLPKCEGSKPEVLIFTFTGNMHYSMPINMCSSRLHLADELRMLAYELEKDEIAFCNKVKNPEFIKG